MTGPCRSRTGEPFIVAASILGHWTLGVETPEPASFALLGTGIMGLMFFGRKAVCRKG